MNKFGLIGYPLSHSFSPKYFKTKFEKEDINDCVYDLYPLEKIEQVRDLFPLVKGLNVTIPYKEKVMEFLDEIDPVAQKIGAVNTIKVTPTKTIGYNTDVYGFEESLKPLLHHQKGAFILGTGGASKAVKYVLDKLGIEAIFLSRSPRPDDIWCYGAADNPTLRQHYSLVINTTPLGMYPHIEKCPQLPYHLYNNQALFYDLVYNPSLTTFLQKAQMQGATIKNGLEMLELQAERSWEIWQS